MKEIFVKKPEKKPKIGIKVEHLNQDLLYKNIEEYRQSTKKQKDYENILHSLNSLYSSEFFKQLKIKLGKPSTFKKAKKEKKKKIQEGVDSLFLLETHYKYYHKKTKFQQKPLLKILKTESNSFKALYNNFLNNRSHKKNVNKKFFENRITNYLKHCLCENPLLNDLINPNERKILKSLDYSEIFKSIPSDEIFLFLCACAVRIAYRNLINASSEIYPNNKDLYSSDSYDSYLKIELLDLKNIFKFRFFYLLVSLVLEKLEQVLRNEKEEIIKPLISELSNLKLKQLKMKKLAEEQVIINYEKKINEIDQRINELESKIKIEKIPEDYHNLKLTSILSKLKKNKSLLESENEFENLEGGCLSILDIFCKTVISDQYNILNRDESTGRVYTQTILVLPNGFNNIHSFSDHLPRIVEPDDWLDDGTYEGRNLSKIIHMGISDVKYDTVTINSINETQKKKFKINEKFLNLLKRIDDSPLEETKNMDLPFPTKNELKMQKNLIDKLKLSIGLPKYKKNLIQKIYQKELNSNSYHATTFNYSNFWNGIYKNFTEIEILEILKIKEQEDIFAQMSLKKQIFNTMIECGEIYKGFPLYFDTYTDYRGRLYPGIYLFSRTTGFYKYLVTDYKTIKLNLKGFSHLLKGYFKNDSHILKKLEEEKVTTLDDYHEFFLKENKNYKKPKKNILYFLLLEDVLLNLRKENYRTNIGIEIDQTGSHAVFCALILGNEALARESNLLGTVKKDVNLYLQNNFKKFIEYKIKKEEKEEKEEKKKKKRRKKISSMEGIS